MKFEDRKYQTDCVEAWFSALQIPGKKPVVAIPTGGGKSIILCRLVGKLLDDNRLLNILVLSHTKEIVQQDYNSMLEFFPSFGLGIYCAGLNRREIKKVTLGTIGSVYNKRDLFVDFDICIIDEVHAVSHKNVGMYRKLFNHIDCKVTGMSATLFRTGHGHIYEENKEKESKTIFNHLAFDLTTGEDFTKLIDDGYLCNLYPRETKFYMDSTGVKESGGDYNLKSLAERHDTIENTEEAVSELIKYKKAYKKWLIFTINIEHANRVTEELHKRGVRAYTLHSKIEFDRDRTVEAFREGKVQALVTVGMATTGLDIPDIDLIGMLRPTKSYNLHRQMIGRGLRVHPNKKHCVVLDFAGNVETLGPVNCEINFNMRKKRGIKPVMAKACKVCRTLNALAAKRCIACGALFPIVPKKKKLNKKAGKEQIVARKNSKHNWKQVDYVNYQIHKKPGSNDSLRVTYRCGKSRISKWVCLNHTGFAKEQADYWVSFMEPTCRVFTTEFLFLRRDKIKVPEYIKCERNNGFLEIIDYKFNGDSE